MAELDVVLEKLTNMAEDIAEIKQQVKTTNGCVRDHESRLVKVETKVENIEDHDTRATAPMNESVQITPKSLTLIIVIIALISVGGSVAATKLVGG
jgi:hypothetical protein